MPAPTNQLKAALLRGEVQSGLWLAQASATVAEIAGQSGFDWCLIDAEHGPNTLTTIRAQLQALAGTPAQPVVRVPVGEDWVLKQVLDLGVQTVVVPMVNTAEQAAQVAAAVRYPGQGVRGMGAVLSRATRYGEIVDYVSSANDEICLFVQVESAEAVRQIDAIAATPGVDGIFVGPADLSADMGFVGAPDAAPVQEAIAHVYARTKAAGKIIGTIMFDEAAFAPQVAQGVTFLGLGGDSILIARAFRALAAQAPKNDAP
ncbi:HpcH/HpaI aldolase family protein [Thalassorhabdomicrobium marinisediminis]|uniref:Hydroxypyruvate/pyruvate aldolase n=1 Tax=Thalassorhabdomicrobium marinisediminis TaxID=2170577 RepID=A0A2T7FV84_9RHOB|nr:HpcH/HpaI aldolase/citrate lyase family protein [Thalassorhabdomicrobium marinisediminis]PVA06065.1 2-keto-3-deoxy-L-rhamnonate aldolase [Thalassorhabdomicrobium marinisediminis]